MYFLQYFFNNLKMKRELFFLKLQIYFRTSNIFVNKINFNFDKK